jgi:hypothetical protein
MAKKEIVELLFVRFSFGVKFLRGWFATESLMKMDYQNVTEFCLN